MNQSCVKVLFFYIILLYYASYNNAQAQESIKNISIEPKDELIQINYDLQSTEPGLLFKVTPYYLDSLGASHQMHKVAGDAGDSISLGNDKMIQWFYHREVKGYDGEMKVELVYEVLPPAISIPLDQQLYRRASNIHLKHGETQGTRYEIVDLQRRTITEGKLNQEKLKLPHDLRLSQDYRIRIWNDMGEAPSYTSVFSVKRNIPWALRALGLGIIIGGAYYLLQPGPSNELPLPYTKGN